MNPNNTIDLARLIANLPGPIHLFLNPGNAGDSLIACATHQFLEKHNINYIIETDIDANLSSKTVIFSGGGNFGGDKSIAAKYLKKFAFSSRHFVLLPHTLFGAEDLLASLPNTVHIICRERVSFEHAKKYCNNALVHLHDDMVFDADVRSLISAKPQCSVFMLFIEEIGRRLRGISDYDFGISLRCVVNYQLFRVRSLFSKENCIENDVLNAFRMDVEKTDIDIPFDNVDISDLYELSACDPDLALLSAKRFLMHINKFEVVNTNRLHVAIAAIKLGKKVNLYGNNYFKIRAIYDYSIKERFKNVTWIT